jgi:hypothetical protein
MTRAHFQNRVREARDRDLDKQDKNTMTSLADAPEQQQQQHDSHDDLEKMARGSTEFVKKLARRTNLDHDQVAREMAPFFGLGQDVLAVQRARCLFLYLKRSEALALFSEHYIAGGWGHAIPEWRAVLGVAREHLDDPAWCALAYPNAEITAEWEVQHHYAKFIVYMIKSVGGRENRKNVQLVQWLSGRPDPEKFWTLFHALMYFQLDQETDNMPRSERIIRQLALR